MGFVPLLVAVHGGGGRHCCPPLRPWGHSCSMSPRSPPGRPVATPQCGDGAAAPPSPRPRSHRSPWGKVTAAAGLRAPNRRHPPPRGAHREHRAVPRGGAQSGSRCCHETPRPNTAASPAVSPARCHPPRGPGDKALIPQPPPPPGPGEIGGGGQGPGWRGGKWPFPGVGGANGKEGAQLPEGRGGRCCLPAHTALCTQSVRGGGGTEGVTQSLADP